MTDKEIIQALRCCEREKCGDDSSQCPLYSDSDCITHLSGPTADLIEKLTAENADLRKELEWKGMVIALAQRKQTEAEAERDALLVRMKAYRSCYECKHGDYCEFDDVNTTDCLNCVKKNCPCAQCCDTSRWEWRGLPDAPEEAPNGNL